MLKVLFKAFLKGEAMIMLAESHFEVIMKSEALKVAKRVFICFHSIQISIEEHYMLFTAVLKSI